MEEKPAYTGLKYKTRGNASPQGRPRVYFCCHEADFAVFFTPITDEILEIQTNAAIWYREPEAGEPDREPLFADLSQMQLFVIPVTSRFLYQENFARLVEFQFAIEHHIPVLPLMQESNLGAEFNKCCGDLQYLDKNASRNDPTAISYEEKLKKFLSSILVSDELARQIRGAFDAYIFLSYRKMDRKYAQQIMGLIHSNEFCRDIAIWYDEFLIPGENFNEAIITALKKSGLFALVVTPNLLIEGNYVMTTEYRTARKAGKPVLPIEAVETNHEEMAAHYEGIPAFVGADHPAAIAERLKELLRGIALLENDGDPRHLFFIGLAYLSGVDVEVNHDRALELITRAARMDLPEAYEKLVNMYQTGEGVVQNLEAAISWQKEYRNKLKAAYDTDNSDEKCCKYLSAEAKLAHLELKAKQLKDSRNTCWRIIASCRKNMGYGEFYSRERIPYYLDSYLILGGVFHARNDKGQERECYEKADKTIEYMLQAGTPSTSILKKAAFCWQKLGALFSEAPFFDYRFAEDFTAKALTVFEQLQEQEFNWSVQKSIGLCYLQLGKNMNLSDINKKTAAYHRALDIFLAILNRETTTENYMNVFSAFFSLGEMYSSLDNRVLAENSYIKALEICQKAIEFNKSAIAMENHCICSLRIFDLDRAVKGQPKLEQMCLHLMEEAENLFREYPGFRQQEILGLVYMHSCNCFDAEAKKVYAKQALKIYRNLMEKNRENKVYSDKYFNCRQKLWKKGCLDQKDFPMVKLNVYAEKSGDRQLLINPETGKTYHICIWIDNHFPTTNLEMLEVSEYVLSSMEAAYSAHYLVEPGLNTLQLCQCGGIGTKPDPTPDEFVYVTYSGKEKKRVKYQRCYG